MCGIIGVISKKDIPDFNAEYFEPLNRALDYMEYRGPDNKGLWSDEGICLGHRRLSIIDLSDDGNQPFHYKDDRYIIVFNGEIYNYQELRDDLAKLGHHFSTESDTEVILAAFIQYGEDFCNKFRGMFALVIFDRQEKRVVFTRDRLGKKPLFIFEDENVIIFSSEIKFFHAFNIPLEINPDSVLNFLSLQYIPGPATIYKNIRQLKPAELLIYDRHNNKTSASSYWNMFDYVGKSQAMPEIAEIDALLEESVKYRLVANVDIGLLLSGGIDSSLLATYMHQLAGNKVKAFNVGFSDKSLDESDYAKQVASSMGLDLITLNVEDISPDNFIESIYHGDQPLGDSAIIPTYLIAKSIKEHVKVVLSGEGADELFHGYDHYNYEKYYYGLGKISFDSAASLLQIISASGINKLEKVKNKLKSIKSFKKDTGVSRWTSILSPELTKGFIGTNQRLSDSYEHQFHSFLQDFQKSAGKLESSLMLDLLTWLPDDLLVKTDRMMMACSVEARTPFLDHKLVERVLASSGDFKQSLFQSKNYLRQLLKQRLPASVADMISKRPKQGFETPKVKWLNANLSDISSLLFSEENLRANPYLNNNRVSELWNDFKKQKAGINNRLIWNIFCFLEWYRQHENKFGLKG
ncbi:asparagine synthase (glutamine-hydrolyzing) [Daejeonella lutea]|uniref:asparagine synthase (glutamine-hydrolyzing) n=1 Tax=Daejeonella lutea TaxID=572036 RepID=A0A1T5FAG4_9SPHI|nr:asparagine synthase (glutamine-hydrolyzing) [Daejeonella lutea]SKB93116.1 asparagine synthase (glutamine-hydrolysing) [Daejeonella lutea]